MRHGLCGGTPRRGPCGVRFGVRARVVRAASRMAERQWTGGQCTLMTPHRRGGGKSVRALPHATRRYQIRSALGPRSLAAFPRASGAGVGASGRSCLGCARRRRPPSPSPSPNADHASRSIGHALLPLFHRAIDVRSLRSLRDMLVPVSSSLSLAPAPAPLAIFCLFLSARPR